MNLPFVCGADTVQMEVIFRKRRTMEIQVHPPGIVRVLVPVGTPKCVILEGIQSKNKWITEKINQIKAAGCSTADKELVSGKILLYLGRKYSLQIKVDCSLEKPSVKLNKGKFMVVVPDAKEEIIRAVLREWYIKRAESKIAERVEYYALILKKSPSEIRVKDQKRRWGSCTSDGKVFFNWRSVMAPVCIIDYLVVHELCHLHHMNHSKVFWQLVASILPDYKERREWLKKNGLMLDL